jgi:tetratricopeptide (TPR) repeat protein
VSDESELSMSGPSAPSKVTVGQLLKAGEQLHRQGRAAEAQGIYRKILEALPQHPIATHYLALTLKASEPTEAERLMRRSIELEPREPSFHNNLGNLLRANSPREAEGCYREAIRLKADYAEAHYNLGVVLKNQGKLAEALDALKEAVRARPNYPEALVQIGAIFKENGKYDEALAVLERAVSVRKDYYDALYYRGTTLSALGRYDEAFADLKQAATLRPQGHEALSALGNALQHLGHNEHALEAYWHAIQAKPDFMSAHYDYSNLAWTLGRRDLHFKSYAYAREKLPGSADVLFGEAELRFKLAQHPAAETLLRQAHEMAPERADIIDALARSLSAQRKYDDCYPVFEKAIAAKPDSVAYRQGFAVALLNGKQPKEALRVLEEARALRPFDQLTLGGMTLAYRELGDSRYDALVNTEKFVRVIDVPLPSGFSDAKAFNRELAPVLESLHTRNVEPFDQTLRGGTQTFGFLFNRQDKMIAAVRESIEACVRQYIAELPDDAQHPLLMRKSEDFTFNGSWSCRLRSQGFHTNHVHPMGWISSAYYVDVPDEVDDDAAKQGWLKFGESHLKLSGLDRPAKHVKPVIGRLALFPSYFWHGTVPFTSSHNRLTIAFDVVPGKQTIKDSERSY